MNFRKGFVGILLLILLAVVILAGGAAYLFLNQASPQTETWVTYRNDRYRFELKYPREMQVREKPFPNGQGTIITVRTIDVDQIYKYGSLIIFASATTTDEQGFFKDSTEQCEAMGKTAERSTRDGLPSVTCTPTSESAVGGNLMVFNKPNQINIEYSLPASVANKLNGDDRISSQIVSTFKSF